MYEGKAMHKVDALQELKGVLTDLIEGKGSKTVSSQLLIQGGTELFKDHANMRFVVKPRVELDAMTKALRIVYVQMQQYVNFEASCISVLINIANDLDSDALSFSSIPTFDNLAKCALSKFAEDLVSAVWKVWNGMETFA